MAKQKDYFGLDGLLSLILAIIPFTSWICGAITRFQEKKYVAALIRLIGGFTVVWIIDLVFMLKDKQIFRVLDI